MSEQNDDRQYTKGHVWAKIDEETQQATIGLSTYFIEQLPEITSMDIPEEGDEIDVGAICMHFHIGNRILHLRSPLTGRVIEVNKEVLDNSSLIHLDPDVYWIFRMEFDNLDELDLLMDARQYAEYIDEK